MAVAAHRRCRSPWWLAVRSLTLLTLLASWMLGLSEGRVGVWVRHVRVQTVCSPAFMGPFI